MESTCVPDDSIPFEEQLQKSLSFIEGSYEEIELEELNEELTAEVVPAVLEVKNFSYALIDDRLYYRENSLMRPVEASEGMLERIKGMVAIRDCTRELIRLQLEDEAALAEYCAGIDHFLENILEKTKQRADITYSEFQEIRATRGLMRLQQGLRNNRSYAVPIQTADGVTQMNLTFREDEEQAGKVQVTIWQPYRISMEMQISGGSLKGLVLCDDRAGYEKLKQQAGALQETLEQNVCPVKTISYGMDFRAQNDYSAASENDNAVDTKALYQTAKVLVQYISEVVATENGGLQ